MKKSMETCVEVLYELKKIDAEKRKLLLEGTRSKEYTAYKEIENLLGLLERGRA